MRRRREPKPPVDIRLHLRDGTVLAVEAVYTGFDEDERLHVWTVVNFQLASLDQLERMTVAVLPARTAIRIKGADEA